MTNEQRWPYRSFWQYALLLTVFFWLVHLAGFRVHTSVWSGTHSGDVWAQFAGGMYLLFYFLWVCLAPIFTIAGGLLWIGEKCFGSS